MKIKSGFQMQMNKLHEILKEEQRIQESTGHGTLMHKKLQYVFLSDSGNRGDLDICEKLSVNPELREYCGLLSKTEVPIAGKIGDEFISRRIDRLYINPEKKKIVVLDYKTDTDRQEFRQKYITQLGEYHELLSQIYPDFTISCKILWLSDFTLENII